MTSTQPSQPSQTIGDYLVHETIGKGSFGKVKRGTHIPTGERVAIKMLNRQKLKKAHMDKKIMREINILKLFQHPNICRLYEVLQTDEDIFLIMEHVEGGELYDYIVKKGQLEEDAARSVFQQIVCALEYCHHFRVVHRDLKPENILLGPTLQVKLIDFGLANLMRDGDFLATSCGSPNYAAPEVISGRLYSGPEVDVWSCGVVLYALLCGCLPFDEDTIPLLFAKIKKGKYDIPPHVSLGARHLLAQLLTVDPLHRCTIAQIRDNRWFATRLPAHLASNIEHLTEELRMPAATLRLVADKLKISVATARQQVQQRTGKAHTTFNILDDIARRTLISSGPCTASSSLTVPPDPSSASGAALAADVASAGGSTAAAKELNLGLVLSVSPAVEQLLDGGDATSNKDLYNMASFVPVSNRSLGGAQSSLGAGSSIGGFSLTRNQGLRAEGAGFGSLRSTGTSLQAQPRPSPLAHSADSSQPRVGSVARTVTAYSAHEAQVAVQASTGWRIGLMTNRRSADVMAEVFATLAALDMSWKVLSPFRIAARATDPPTSNAGKARAAAAAARRGASGTPASPLPILVFHIFRMQERHDKGYIVDFAVRGEAHPLAMIDLAVEVFEALNRRLG